MQADPGNSGPSISRPTSWDLSSFTTLVPLFHAACLFAAGIAFTQIAWLRPSYLLVALIPVAILCGVAALRAQRILSFPLAVLWCLLGAWCAEMEPQPSPSVTVAGLSDGLMRTVEGTIVDAGPLRRELEINIDEPGAESPTQRIDLRVASIESVTNTEDTQVPVDGGVRLTVHWPQVFGGQAIPQTFRCGERVRAEIQLLTPQEYRDPGAWSRTEYLLDQGITSTASVKVERIKSLGQDGNRSLACRITEWQRTMSGRLLGLPIAMQGLPIGTLLR